MNHALRKSAILISTLDERSAESLLEKMPPEIAEQVRTMVTELTEIPAEEQEAVIREFMLAGGNDAAEEFDGVELDPSLAVKLRTPDGYPSSTSPAAAAATPFRFLHEATAEALARHLQRQHPQVIAVVTAHLPPRQAADVIKRLTPQLQADVLRRVAELDLADQEALRDVELELELLLSDDLRLARNRQSGLAVVSTILNAAGKHQQELLDNLARHELFLASQLSGAKDHSPGPAPPGNSERPRPKPAATSAAPPLAVSRSVKSSTEKKGWEPRTAAGPPPAARPTAEDGLSSIPAVDFEQLAQLSDDDWAALIRAADPPIVLLALTGASEPLLKRITERLSRREAQSLQTRLEQQGPIRLSDIEQAQLTIANLARRLAARGTIQLPERRGFAAAA
jgi:flagellar motor switch protein FliG